MLIKFYPILVLCKIRTKVKIWRHECEDISFFIFEMDQENSNQRLQIGKKEVQFLFWVIDWKGKPRKGKCREKEIFIEINANLVGKGK